MKLEQLHTIYFIGIGGIGMSALARFFNQRGIQIAGYDRTETTLTKKLVAEGIDIHYEEEVTKIPNGIDLVVYTPAIPKSNKELQYLQEREIPIKKRSEVLGMISRRKRTIAVAGTHGKTTTSAILTHLLKAGGIDCTAFLGGMLNNYQSNYINGKSEWVVVEADEYDRSFLQLTPEIGVIISMDPDHLDIYGDLETMRETGFLAFSKRIDPKGTLLVNQELKSFFKEKRHITYGLKEGTYLAENIRVEKGKFVFDYKSPIGNIENLETNLPGRHNVENAVAAISIAQQLDIKAEKIREGMVSFGGIKRRFERVFEDEQSVYIDDYAHHPTELRAAISAAKELFPGRWICGIFQPHLFSRTVDFATEFGEALDLLDEVILLEIYPAREKPIEGVDSGLIFKKIRKAKKRMINKEHLLNTLKDGQIDVLLTLGAGDIDLFVEPIKELLKSEQG
ncbi:MAG: UDP-N-acetylmuramate--L-alanine ligase [Bacteroidetes bacterium]|nr:UDP-N-acetylmuramate--L-alanine ligase [Bacteroidota bacterium]